jgi:hypothetical protein
LGSAKCRYDIVSIYAFGTTYVNGFHFGKEGPENKNAWAGLVHVFDTSICASVQAPSAFVEHRQPPLFFIRASN